MAVVIINPNSTQTMTQAMTQAARIAVPEMRFDGWTSADGPPAIQGAQDGAAATPPLLELVQKANKQGADGIIIGCFDDTGLQEAAGLASCPVIGIGQAAFHLAALRNWRFSVVTTMPASVPVIEANIDAMGLRGFVGQVRASNVPVLDLETNAHVSEKIVLDEAASAEREDDVDAVILGCAGMTTLTDSARRALGCVVIDPVIAAASCMKWLC